MKNSFVLLLLGVALLVGTSSAAFAQEKRLDSSSAAFRTFYTKFIAAVHRGDKKSVASMISFPLTCVFGEEDAGKTTKKEFMDTAFRRMFGTSPKSFLTSKNPIVVMSGEDTSYTVTASDTTQLIFTSGGNRFFFTDYLVGPL